MTSDFDNYESPLSTRYACEAMRRNFSANRKFTTWRRLWIALAEAEHELGLPVTAEQVEELRAHLEPIDHELAARYEKELRHDVMAHIHTWGEVCPKARGIIHLGATSCYVTDNAELIAMREGVRIVRTYLVAAIRALREFALEWRHLPVLGLTHYQPAQATTLGKRAALWLQDFVFNLVDLDHAEEQIRFRGVKGTTGSQVSFLGLFDGDAAKVRELDRRVREKMGFERGFAVTGQTYPRQLDFRVGQVLAGIAQSAAKFAVDLRLAAGRNELGEPFGEKQIGSSAMPWKRNPMRCERIGALARHVIITLGDTAHTAANQWFERTLDDSANRRISIPELFLGTDAILQLVLNVASGIVVNPAVIERHLAEELPFLASETLMMEAVRAGADRQDAHERIRVLSHQAAAARNRGEDNPFRELLAAEPLFADVAARWDRILDPARFVGCAPEQVERFIAEEVDPLLKGREGGEAVSGEVRV